ncbi:uncharacterized protein VTP21DRAFT_8181 [Calcarisporiella thermophila]|uniref:uncharacterized protein n=1 Tax=Calcarisporiella thermophila TaxID=911321 RepID=UPI003744971B
MKCSIVKLLVLFLLVTLVMGAHKKELAIKEVKKGHHHAHSKVSSSSFPPSAAAATQATTVPELMTLAPSNAKLVAPSSAAQPGYTPLPSVSSNYGAVSISTPRVTANSYMSGGDKAAVMGTLCFVLVFASFFLL